MLFKNKSNKKAFTLVELIVVMAVIGILVLLAMPKFIGYTEKAQRTKLFANAKNLETASERYYMDHQEWPRLSDEPYNADKVEAFANKIYDITGNKITLDPNGDYYDIDYDSLVKYISIPDDKENYILQNPVGNIYVLEGLTEQAKGRFETPKDINNKPTAVISMMPNSGITTTTNITWDYSNSNDPDGDDIVAFEWQGKQDSYTALGDYIVKLRVQDSRGLWSDWTEISFDVTQAFGYTGNYQTFTVPKTGTYKLEVWGAEGGKGYDNGLSTSTPGKGGYSYGEQEFVEGQIIYIYVGGKGGDGKSSGAIGGFNGGANGRYYLSGSGGGGGGATHIGNRSGLLKNLASYKSDILIVAGGGGGSDMYGGADNGGYGGGLTGGNGSALKPLNSANTGMGGTQTSGGIAGRGTIAGSFGSGGGDPGLNCYAAGGGGGYYGGGGGRDAGGGGGSSYIGGVINSQTIAGNQSMPTHDGTGNIIGNTGHGYAKITYINK